MSRLGKALLPLAWRYVSKRMLREEEAAWRQAERRGQGDEWLKKRWRQSSDRSARSQVLIRFPLSHRPSSSPERPTTELRSARNSTFLKSPGLSHDADAGHRAMKQDVSQDRRYLLAAAATKRKDPRLRERPGVEVLHKPGGLHHECYSLIDVQ